MSAYPSLNNATLQPEPPGPEPYFVEAELTGCPHCGEGRTWTVVGPDGDPIGESWGADEDGDCPSDAYERCDALNRAYAHGQANPVVTNAMVDRFLTWKLPDDFAPDGGIDFTPPSHWPTGTNLLTATQARSLLDSVLNPPRPDDEWLLNPPPMDCHSENTK